MPTQATNTSQLASSQHYITDAVMLVASKGPAERIPRFVRQRQKGQPDANGPSYMGNEMGDILCAGSVAVRAPFFDCFLHRRANRAQLIRLGFFPSKKERVEFLFFCRFWC
jgi:hypothetical protein